MIPKELRIDESKIGDKSILRTDIKDLKEKLLYLATIEIKNPEIVTGEDGKKRNISEAERRQKVRQMKNRLKELIGIFNIIEEAETITGK